MKLLLTFLILINISYAFQTKEALQIGQQHFIIVHESYDEYNDKGITMKLYKKGEDTDSQPLFSFTLENQSGGCGEQSSQEGSYELNGTMLTLYSHWDRSGKAYDTPKGDRIQHYKIDENGTIAFLDGALYIETEAKNYDKQSAIKYLHTTPTNADEKKALNKYIQSVEKHFKGRFVRGDKAQILHQKIDKALMEKRKTRWK